MKLHKSGALACLFLSVAAISWSACDGETNPPPPPAEFGLTAVSPRTLSMRGGVRIRLTGTAFEPGSESDTEIAVDGQPCTQVAIESETSATCLVPPHVPAVVDITMTNADDETSTLTQIFTYIATGTIVEYAMPAADDRVTAVTSGPDGNIWFATKRDDDSLWAGQITPEGAITQFALPASNNPGASVDSLVAGPDGNLWYTSADNRLSRLTPQGQVTQFNAPGATNVTVGADGNLWVAEFSGGKVDVYSTQGTIVTSYASGMPIDYQLQDQAALPAPGGGVLVSTFAFNHVALIKPGSTAKIFDLSAQFTGIFRQLTYDLLGNAWIAAADANQIVRLNLTTGLATGYALPTANADPYGMALGADGNVWFTESTADKIGRITPTGMITEFPVSGTGNFVWQICSGSDGNLWFAEYEGKKIGKIFP